MTLNTRRDNLLCWNTLTRLFRPGAGDQPPRLAGRGPALKDLDILLGDLTEDGQNPPRDAALVGPRGNGKTALLDAFRRRCAGVDVVSLAASEIKTEVALFFENNALTRWACFCLLVALLCGIASVTADDTRFSALEIAVNGSVTGEISPEEDVDYWRINVPSAGQLVVETSGATDTIGRIEDSAGNTLEEDDDSGEDINFKIERAVTAGTYYIRVGGYDEDVTGDYTLHALHTSTEGGSNEDGSGSAQEDPAHRILPLGDFNGDGKDDVLLRHEDGRWYYYPMDGRNPIADQRGPAGLTRNLAWQVAGIGDMNGDGRDDVLLRHEDGRWYYYPMDGRRFLADERGYADLTRDLAWQVAGIGDLNGDSKDDVLLRHTDGRWDYYPMDGRNPIADQRGPAGLTRDLAWQVAGIGDLNGDGKDDVLLRHTDSRWYYYPMDGRRYLADERGYADLTRKPDWQVAGIGDLNGDGKDDVLVRHEDGRWFYYPMNGRSHITNGRGYADLTRNLAWQVAGIGDLDGDGKDDVLLRNEDGRWFYYPMNGRSHLTGGRGQADLTTDTGWMTSRSTGAASPVLAVESLWASDSHLTSAESFTLTVTVRNRGDLASAATRLRYYRSSDPRIARADTEVGESPVDALDAGAGFMGVVTLNAPEAAGVYWYGACVDAAGGGCSGGVRIEVDASDLAVPSLSLVGGGNLRPGESFTLSAGVRNWGRADSGATRLRFYRSADSRISPDDTVVDERALDGIEAGRSYRESVTLPAPTEAGVYWYGACVEPVAGERNTGNNCSSGFAIGVDVPDLAISVLELYLEEDIVNNTRTLKPGDPIMLRVTVVNRGNGLSEASRLRYYWSSDAHISTADTEVGSDRVGSLSAGASSTESITFAAPSGVGTYWYGACVDSIPGERDTGNNCLGGGWFQVARPDLVVDRPAVSDSNLASGGSFSLSVTISNQGGAASDATRLVYYRSSDRSISSADTQVGTDTVAALPASGTQSSSITLTAPDTAGAYWYGACVDSRPGENDTGNNCSAGVQVNVDRPDLALARPTVSDASPEAGASFSLSVTLRNLGHGPSDASTLRYYRSSDRTISSADTQVGTDSVAALPASGSASESITLSAPSQDGTYWYGACVDSVNGESNTSNNCSGGVRVTASDGVANWSNSEWVAIYDSTNIVSSKPWFGSKYQQLFRASTARDIGEIGDVKGCFLQESISHDCYDNAEYVPFFLLETSSGDLTFIRARGKYGTSHRQDEEVGAVMGFTDWGYWATGWSSEAGETYSTLAKGEERTLLQVFNHSCSR